MERMTCVLMEDNVLEFLDEVEKQMQKKLVCCKCPNPCNGQSRCSMSMKNLLTDIHLFMEAYKDQNNLKNIEQKKV